MCVGLIQTTVALQTVSIMTVDGFKKEAQNIKRITPMEPKMVSRVQSNNGHTKITWKFKCERIASHKLNFTLWSKVKCLKN